MFQRDPKRVVSDYAAKRAMADLYERLGREGEASRLRDEAARLKELVHEAFWMPTEGFYALALDARKRPVDSIASNPGHLLWSGLPDETHARIRVADRGAGVPAADRSRLFEPFFTTRPSGTGLGLAVSAALAQAHGGSVELVDSEARGATFLVTLPIRGGTSPEVGT